MSIKVELSFLEMFTIAESLETRIRWYTKRRKKPPQRVVDVHEVITDAMGDWVDQNVER